MSTLRRWTSEGGSPRKVPLRPTREGSVNSITPDVRCGCQYFKSDALLPERLNPVGTRPTSRVINHVYSFSDHEYEIIEKPPDDITPAREQHGYPLKIDADHIDDERSSTVSLERKSSDENIINCYIADNLECLGYSSSEEIGVKNAETLQQKIEDRFFQNTPSTTESRTECEISTSQVESSALENLPLKRENRTKHFEPVDTAKLQQKIREQTGKLKTQASKLRLRIQNIKSKKMDSTEKKPGSDKSKIQLPKRTKINLPGRPKFTFSDRPQFTLPDRRKFNMPERSKLKKISFPERKPKESSETQKSKFTMPDLPKFKMPEMSKINFSRLSRQPKINNQGQDQVEPKKKLVDFEFQTFPRMFSKTKKQKPEQTISTPSLNRAGTPTPTFTFASAIATKESNKDEYNNDEPRSYGAGFHRNSSFNDDQDSNIRESPTSNNFGQIQADYDAESRQLHEIVESKLLNVNNTSSYPNISAEEQQSTHVINEINNDEFFVRQKGISHEDIEVRQYLSDEIRHAFKVPVNTLAQIETNSRCFNESDQSINENDPAFSTEDTCDTNETFIENDDGYYTFPPVRPSRAERNKNKKAHITSYIEPSINANNQQNDEITIGESIESIEQEEIIPGFIEPCQKYENTTVVEPETGAEMTTAVSAPRPIKRRNKSSDTMSGWGLDFYKNGKPNLRQWIDGQEDGDDVIVYRTEHEYTVPDNTVYLAQEGSPIPPRRRNKSRSSRGTSVGDDDRTSHGAESLILDANISAVESTDLYPDAPDDSPGYAVVEKVSASKQMSAQSRTPPFKPRKSHSSERKYYTVDRKNNDYSTPKYTSTCPSRPPRKKSSTSLMMLETLRSVSSSTDITQYVEIGDENSEECHRDLQSGEVISKMKYRPLPPPPRPPRGPKKKTNYQEKENTKRSISPEEFTTIAGVNEQDISDCDDVVEVEAFTQTDPLPDDVDCDLGIEVTYSEENGDISSSLKNINDDEEYFEKSHEKFSGKLESTPPYSRLDKSFTTDSKIIELSKSPHDRTSPTVILVERRVSSPTRINERDELLTEASLRVESINIPESQIPEVPPLPNSNISRQKTETEAKYKTQEKSSISNPTTHELQVDNLVTQRLQVRDLDVGRLNVSELQASKILVSDLEGLSLQVTELDSKSSNITVNGLELAPSVIDEIVRKFAEIHSAMNTREQPPRPVIKEEETQTDIDVTKIQNTERYNSDKENKTESIALAQSSPEPLPNSAAPLQSAVTHVTEPPQRPPPPDLTPLLFSYLQDLSVPSQSFYHLRTPRDKPFSDFYDSPSHPQPPLSPPPPPTRRMKRKPKVQTDSSSEDEIHTASKRVPVRAPEPSITELGVQFFRLCQISVSRSIRNLMQSVMSYISGNENKKDMQMALVIFLVLIAGLIMFGLSDGHTVHHHHWEFFNPPDGK